jgi:hypothetical protein
MLIEYETDRGPQSGKTVQLYKGHTAPCTSLAFFDDLSHRRVLISGSWDKVIHYILTFSPMTDNIYAVDQDMEHDRPSLSTV